ncbi:MAG: hypothetical protein ACJAYN_000392 [Bermanella sp.]|jgi:hypothetical protein|nr:hypothetical protein [Glaciecola sp. 33A]
MRKTIFQVLIGINLFVDLISLLVPLMAWLLIIPQTSLASRLHDLLTIA